MRARSASSTSATRRASTATTCGAASDADAAHDLTAETFAQAWLSRARFRDEAGGSAGPWLFGIARHVLLVSVRQRRLERSASERLGVLDAADRAGRAEPDETWLDGLDEALAHLPEAQQDAIRLRVVDDLGYDEAADAAGRRRPRPCAHACRAA